MLTVSFHKHILTFLSFLVSLNCLAQSISPIGVTVNLDGTVQVVICDEIQIENRLSDSVYVNDTGFDYPYDWSYLGNKKTLGDFEQEYLILIPPLEPEQVYIHTNLDNFILFDTSQLSLITFTLPAHDSIANLLVLEIDTLSQLPMEIDEEKSTHYENIIDYEGELGDTIVEYFTSLLRAYAFDNWEKHGIDIMQPIYLQLFERDTVIDKEAYFDYKINKLVLYNYIDDNLASVIAFSSRYYGIEYDSLTYNKKNQLVAYHHNQIGDGGTEVFLKYDRKGRVKETTSYSYLYRDHYDSECPDCKRKSSFERKTYFYGKNGLLNRIEIRSMQPIEKFFRTVEILEVKRAKH